MKASGYAGAQHISMEIEHLYGFRATAPEQVDVEVWQQTMDIYIHDKHNLGLEKWFKEANPHARQMVAARLMEIDRQGVYQFSTEDRRHLVRAYLESVNASGVSCYANACANRKLIRHVAITARELNAVSARELRRYEKTVFDATSPAAADLEIRSDGSPPAKHRPLGSRHLSGFHPGNEDLRDSAGEYPGENPGDASRLGGTADAATVRHPARRLPPPLFSRPKYCAAAGKQGLEVVKEPHSPGHKEEFG